MATERMYMVKTGTGEMLGPADQETLCKWAENGKLMPSDQVRSTLIAKWSSASDTDFLKPYLVSQEEEAALKTKQTFWGRVKAKVTLRAPEIAARSGLVSVKLETFPTPGPFLRMFAVLMDAVILLAVLVLMYFGCASLYKSGVLTKETAAYACLVPFFVFFVCYYVFLIGFRAQTVGQRYFGIFLIRRDGAPYWLGRVFFYTVFMMFFWFLTPVAAFCSIRSIPEWLTGMRFACVKSVKRR